MHLAAQPVNQRSVQHGPLVLVSEPRKFHAPTIDRDRTVSRRSEPSSRTTLIGEQPNPWDRIQPQDVFEKRIAALEGGVAALATASGAAAITYTIEALAQAGGAGAQDEHRVLR